MEKKKKKRMRIETKVSTIIILLEVLLVLVPVAALGYILVEATEGQKTPALGNRFAGDLDPAITDSQKNNIQSQINSITGVDNLELNLKSATLRITVDASDSATDDDILEIANEIYDIIDGILPIDTYFTNTLTKRMYDLEIKVSNVNGRTNETIDWSCVEIVKNGTSTEKKVNWVSKAIDEELAEKLRNKN